MAEPDEITDAMDRANLLALRIIESDILADEEGYVAGMALCKVLAIQAAFTADATGKAFDVEWAWAALMEEHLRVKRSGIPKAEAN